MPSATLAMQAMTYTPQSLTEPVGLSVWLLEQPLAASLAIALAGIVAATLLRRREQAKLAIPVGAALIVLAIGVYVLGTLIVTDREQIQSGSTAFVEAAVDGDLEALDELILEAAGLAASGSTVDDKGRERIKNLSQVQAQAELIESWRVSRLQATIDGANIGTTLFRVRATPRDGRLTISWWRLNWRRDASGVWRIGTIDCLAINGHEAGPGLLNWLSAASGRR